MLGNKNENTTSPMAYDLALKYDQMLRNIYLGSVERIIKMLLLTNSGGLITILTYLYRNENNNEYCHALTFFIYGFVACFIVVILDWIGSLSALCRFNARIKKFGFSNESFKPYYFEWCILASIFLVGAISIVCAAGGIYYGYNGFFHELH